MKITIIGAGLGGLATACLLASKGNRVSVYEKNGNAGGKMNTLEAEGFRFDTGPGLLTMPEVLEKVFTFCGVKLSNHLELIPLNPLCKYFYTDGAVFKNYRDLESNINEIECFAPQEVKAFTNFLDYSQGLYAKTADAYIFNPLFNFQDIRGLNFSSFLGIDAFTTIGKRVDSRFESPHLRSFFKRFATYNGSSPLQAPATLNVIPHVEINKGAFYVKGGLYKIIEALTELASSLGVNFHFDSKIEQIIIQDSQAAGIRLSGGKEIHSHLIVANSDVTETILNLIPDKAISSRKKKKMAAVEPSCSGYVLLLGINTVYDQLEHHNVFFSEDSELEFKQIFRDKIMPNDPTIYISNTSHSDPNHAPEESSNLFILVNAPSLSDQYDWNSQLNYYEDKVIQLLENRGLTNLSKYIIYRESITPNHFNDKYSSNKGSIYGISSNSIFSAFNRPKNKSREIEKLYFTGGSTHPGGGIPLVIQSAFNVLELIDRYERH
ncbi:MAG: phytoene desaturase family protein [Balneolaceae bacterium]